MLEEEDGVCGAHLGVDGDGVWSFVAESGDGAACFQGAGEADGADAGVADEGLADLELGVAAGVEVGEEAWVEVEFGDGVGDGEGDEFACAGVCWVSLDDDGAAGGECGGGVASCGGVGEGEVSGAEDGDGPEGAEHASEVGLWGGFAGGLAEIDGGADPAALAYEIGEEAEGVGGAVAFGADAGWGEAGFSGGPGDEVFAAGFDVGGDSCEEFCTGVGWEGGGGVEGAPCGVGGGVDLGEGCGVEGEGDEVAGGGGGRVEGGIPEGVWGAAGLVAGDDGGSLK